MDNTFREQGSDAQRRSGFASVLRILDRLENWLTQIMELTQLTDEEQMSAGIRLSPLTEEEQVGAGIQADDLRNG